MRRSLALTAMALALVLVPAACSDDDASSDAASSSTSSTTSTTAVSTTTSTTATGDGTASTATTTADAPATTTAAGFPPARTDLQHGGTTWAVVLTGGEDADAPNIERAVQAAAAAGYTTGPTDCDEGAAEALDLGSDGAVYTVSVYFDAQAQAEQALTAFHQHGYDAGRVAQLTTYCLD